ncbi:MAG TPA: FHA domain-containing protein [Hyphomicrobiaceae bacterium]|jgi:hypothetical protein|nr:FHA domain-containing protein [Hyphomicrobiaceae bacterium]
MKDDKKGSSGSGQPAQGASSIPNRILGSLRDALNAASRDERSGEITVGERADAAAKAAAAEPTKAEPTPAAATARATATARPEVPTVPAGQQMSAADALREAKTPTRVHFEAEPTTRVVHGAPTVAAAKPAGSASDVGKTQVIRGKPKNVSAAFHQDPVVGWLVVVSGLGLGAYRPIFEGNNHIGRGKNQRIPIDFGDDTISSEEQAYIRYDSMDRSFLFVPNLSKTNIVAVNDKKPTGAVKLEAMDLITMGRTKLAFVPFCGEEFDWSELAELKE